MRHRAPRPLIDHWHRLPRATARLIRGGASPGGVRALVVVTLVLFVGAAGVAVVSVVGGSADRETGSVGIDPAPGLTGSPDGEGRSSTPEMSRSDTRTPSGRSSEPGTPAVEQPETRSPTTGATSPSTPSKPSKPSTPAPPTDSPTAEPTTRSPSASQSSATAHTPRPDRKAPKTNLVSEFPVEDAALFSFRANETATFTCSLDGAGYTPCDRSMSYSDLDPGWHTFAVRATDASGNVDPTPAEVRWLALGAGVGGP